MAISERWSVCHRTDRELGENDDATFKCHVVDLKMLAMKDDSDICHLNNDLMKYWFPVQFHLLGEFSFFQTPLTLPFDSWGILNRLSVDIPDDISKKVSFIFELALPKIFDISKDILCHPHQVSILPWLTVCRETHHLSRPPYHPCLTQSLF